MAMTLRLAPPEQQALELLAAAWGVSKNQAATRAIVQAATRTLAEQEVVELARGILPGFAAQVQGK